MRVSSRERCDPTASTSVATPPPITKAMARTRAQRRPTSRNSLISSADMALPAQQRRFAAGFVLLDSGDAAIGEEQHPIRDFLDAGVVGDDHHGGAELAIDAEQRLDHTDSGLRVQRPGRL